MQIPFADALLSRLGRRETGLERLEEIEDEAAESVDADDLSSAEPTLLLQRMENRLIRHHLAEPEVLSAEELRKLRYILNFARLADFEPGAAGPGGSRGRGDVSVGAEIAPCTVGPITQKTATDSSSETNMPPTTTPIGI